jgi:hypothetical protein
MLLFRNSELEVGHVTANDEVGCRPITAPNVLYIKPAL